MYLNIRHAYIAWERLVFSLRAKAGEIDQVQVLAVEAG